MATVKALEHSSIQTIIYQNLFQNHESTQEFFVINKNYVQTVDFGQLTLAWSDGKINDSDLKVLEVKNCPDFLLVDELLFALSQARFPNLIVVVVTVSESLENPEAFEMASVATLFVNRPMIFQLNSADGEVINIFLKEPSSVAFTKLSAMRIGGAALEFRQILEVYGKLPGGDILKAEMSVIKEKTKQSEARSVLGLRFLNLFVGGCDRIMPWLKASSSHLDLEAFSAYVDYPLDPVEAVDLAWQFKRYDLVEMFVSKDSRFPKDFNIYLMLPNMNVGFKKILDQRQDLHKSIAKKNLEEVSRILSEIQKTRKLKFAFNESGDSAMATLFKNFDIKLYELLMDNGLHFCGKSEKLAMELPPQTRDAIADMNFAYFSPYQAGPDDHPLMERCLLAFDHLDKEFYFFCIRNVFLQMERLQESDQFLHFIAAAPELRFVFDFKNSDVGLMDPRHEKNSTARVSFHPPGFIYISAFQMDLSVCGSIVHALADLLLESVYRNVSQPFPSHDYERKVEFVEAIAECRESYKKDVNSVVSEFSNAIEEFGDNFHKLSSELLRLVPQVLAAYYEFELRATKAKFAKLFSYYSKYVVVEIERALFCEDFTMI